MGYLITMIQKFHLRNRLQRSGVQSADGVGRQLAQDVHAILQLSQLRSAEIVHAVKTKILGLFFLFSFIRVIILVISTVDLHDDARVQNEEFQRA